MQNVDLTKLQVQLTLAGFGPAAAGAHGVASAAKPAWQAGARAALSLRRAPAPAPAPAWKLGLADDDADDLLVDEDALLTEEDLARPAPPTDTGCGPAVKKACKNCSCGRAEATEPVKLTQAMLDRPTSGCGSVRRRGRGRGGFLLQGVAQKLVRAVLARAAAATSAAALLGFDGSLTPTHSLSLLRPRQCALGDAYRCGGCPYRGLPAFEMGKKIELPPDFLLADA